MDRLLLKVSSLLIPFDYTITQGTKIHVFVKKQPSNQLNDQKAVSFVYINSFQVAMIGNTLFNYQ